MDLSAAIDNYIKVLEEARSPGIASWKPAFLERCSEWCLFIEAELLSLGPKEAEACLADCPCEPALLRDAQRVLFRAILGNVYAPQDLYWSVLSNYTFLSHTEDRETLLLNVWIYIYMYIYMYCYAPIHTHWDHIMQDLSDMAREAAGVHLLQDMKDELDVANSCSALAEGGGQERKEK